MGEGASHSGEQHRHVARGAQSKVWEWLEKGLVHVDSDTQDFTEHVHREHDQMADTWANQAGGGGRDEVWTNKRKWNLKDIHSSRDAGMEAREWMVMGVEW